jgi:hypothetical protein
MKTAVFKKTDKIIKVKKLQSFRMIPKKVFPIFVSGLVLGNGNHFGDSVTAMIMKDLFKLSPQVMNYFCIDDKQLQQFFPPGLQ